MGNHYHLLVTCDIAKLSAMMHKLNVSYAMYFNTKYERDGHLFQGRFKSVPVNSDEQYLTVLRYIHQNPEKAGICPTVAYPWSSYRSYIRGSGIASRELALSLLGGIEEFEAFHRNLENDTVLSCLLDGDTLSEEELEDVARDVLCGVNPQDIRTFSPSERREFIRELKRAHLTVRQIENLTGISRSTISRVK